MNSNVAPNAAERIAHIQRLLYVAPSEMLHEGEALLADSIACRDLQTQVQASVFLAIIRNQLGVRLDDCQLLPNALQICEENDFKQLSTQVLEMLGRDRYSGGLYVESLAYWKQCIEVCRQLRHCGRAHVLALIGLGHVCSAYSEHLQAVEFHRAALQLLQLHPDALIHVKALLSLGWDLFNAGEIDEAIRILQQTTELSREHQFGHYVSESLLHLGTIYLKQHELARAEMYFEECLESMQETPSHWAECNLMGMLAEIRFLQGSPQMAREIVERGIHLAQQDGLRHVETKLNAQAASYCAALNDDSGVAYYGRQLEALHEENTASWNIPAIDLSNIRQYLPG
ncbi:tetratricopeptide repeat protein [Chitinibacter sp. S2-10]|uniref:tetratricopeptide repeat protein n=1 Tax=Chitinibacter sp. S2-10 TaxID=3373597 RepID=UPI0039773EBE